MKRTLSFFCKWNTTNFTFSFKGPTRALPFLQIYLRSQRWVKGHPHKVVYCVALVPSPFSSLLKSRWLRLMRNSQVGYFCTALTPAQSQTAEPCLFREQTVYVRKWYINHACAHTLSSDTCGGFTFGVPC